MGKFRCAPPMPGLRRLRKGRDIPLDELARAVYYSPRTIQGWEMGESHPRPEAVAKLCEILKCKKEELW